MAEQFVGVPGSSAIVACRQAEEGRKALDRELVVSKVWVAAGDQRSIAELGHCHEVVSPRSDQNSAIQILNPPQAGVVGDEDRVVVDGQVVDVDEVVGGRCDLTIGRRSACDRDGESGQGRRPPYDCCSHPSYTTTHCRSGGLACRNRLVFVESWCYGYRVSRWN